MKICSKCKESLPLDDYALSRSSKDGRGNNCRKCNAEYAKAWRENNPERAKEHSRRQTKLLLERNPEYYNEWGRKDYQSESGRLRVIANAQRRRARLLECEGDFTAEEFAELCLLYDGKCLSCERTDLRLTVDHVIPVSKGGRNSIDNIQPLCRQCNSRKRDKDTDFRSKFAL